VGELVAAVGQHPQRLELTIVGHHPQPGRSCRDDGDGVRIQGVGFAVVAGVEQPDSGRELRWHIDHLLAGRDQALGQRTTGTVGSLDRPEPVRPLLHIAPHRGITALVGRVATSSPPLLVVVEDLDRDRVLWGSTPMITVLLTSPTYLLSTDRDGEVGFATTSWADHS